MDQQLLDKLRRGDKDQLKQLAGEKHRLKLMNHHGNTLLHIAARFRNESVVQEILSLEPSLMSQRNRNGETPLHIAARAGDTGVVKIFIDHTTNTTVEIEEENLLRIKDNEGNTPLHHAVRNGHKDVTLMFLRKDQAPALYVNKAGESPLSIAVDANLKYIAAAIMLINPNSIGLERPDDEMTLLHSVIIRGGYERVLVKILGWRREFIHMLDKSKRNPLHYAATTGQVDITCCLLEMDVSLAYQGDCNGQTPLHLATENGRLSVLEKLLDHCPDAIEVLDQNHRSILHLAAQTGVEETILCILKFPVEDFINLPDVNGYTPLHLAVMHSRENLVEILSRSMKVNIKMIKKRQFQPTAVGIVSGSKSNEKDSEKAHTTSRREVEPSTAAKKKQSHDSKDDDRQKDIAETILVMATFIASFSFTAAFNVPEGYIENGPDKGSAILTTRTGFQAFVMLNTLAMTNSMAGACRIFWHVWFGDGLPSELVIFISALTTWGALVLMSLAFATGLFVVLSQNMALAVIVCLIACSLPCIFFVLIIYEIKQVLSR